jgi:hypothetical protein
LFSAAAAAAAATQPLCADEAFLPFSLPAVTGNLGDLMVKEGKQTVSKALFAHQQQTMWSQLRQ